MVNPGGSSQPPAVGTSSLSWKRCAGCGGKIADRFLLYTMDSYWHSRCLKCSCCQAQLGEIGTSCYTKSGMILCRNDYIRWEEDLWITNSWVTRIKAIVVEVSVAKDVKLGNILREREHKTKTCLANQSQCKSKKKKFLYRFSLLCEACGQSSFIIIFLTKLKISFNKQREHLKVLNNLTRVCWWHSFW